MCQTSSVLLISGFNGISTDSRLSLSNSKYRVTLCACFEYKAKLTPLTLSEGPNGCGVPGYTLRPTPPSMSCCEAAGAVGGIPTAPRARGAPDGLGDEEDLPSKAAEQLTGAAAACPCCQ
eukprot:scaffold1626_cov372-Prasinococcus_capsulatus_cf.AAC.21